MNETRAGRITFNLSGQQFEVTAPGLKCNGCTWLAQRVRELESSLATAYPATRKLKEKMTEAAELHAVVKGKDKQIKALMQKLARHRVPVSTDPNDQTEPGETR